MSIRRILAPLTGAASDMNTLTLAFTVARDLFAHVDALFVRPDPTDALPYLGEGMSGPVVEDLIVSAKAAGVEAGQAARRTFEETARATKMPLGQAMAPGHVSVRFNEQVGRLPEVVAVTSRLADLVIFPEPASNVVPTMLGAVEAALMSAVRPILLAPRGAPIQEIGNVAVVAWDGSAEAAHALSASLPLLARATKIEIVTVTAGSAPMLAGDEVVTYLGLHGLGCSVHVLDSHGKPVGQVVLDFATNIGAGLLVIGGYGHSRLREFILGGTTRRILSNCAIPVFVSH